MIETRRKTPPPQNANRALAMWMNKLKLRTVDAAHEIDCFTASIQNAAGLRSLNDLASNLEIMESQIDYYFPEPGAEMESDEWQDVVAMLSTGADWLENQTLDIGLQFDSDRLSTSLRELAKAYSDSIPLVIAARFGHDDRHSPRSVGQRLIGKLEQKRAHSYELLEPVI